MSRLAKKIIELPEGVSIKEDDGRLIVSGAKGELRLSISPHTKVVEEGNVLRVEGSDAELKGRANLGTMWARVKNAVQGVEHGFSKILEIEGVGYRAAVEGNTLVLALGYVNPVRLLIPSGIQVSVEKNIITVSGIDKELVGRFAAEIRSLKKPEPYKGKGIRYRGEVIRRKAGKKATGVQA